MIVKAGRTGIVAAGLQKATGLVSRASGCRLERKVDSSDDFYTWCEAHRLEDNKTEGILTSTFDTMACTLSLTVARVMSDREKQKLSLDPVNVR